MEIKASIAEIVDKFSILIIKSERIRNISKLRNINIEYNYLKEIIKKINFDIESEEYKKLHSFNLHMWDIEEKIRLKESIKEFDKEFIELARNSRYFNDKRAEIKKAINLKYNSEIIEEKSYEEY